MAEQQTERKQGKALTDEAVAEIRRLQQEGGGLVSPADIVAEAASPDSPLHGFFEWNDGAAADRYRLWQAQHLLARVKVRVVTPNRPEGIITRAFVSLPEDRQGSDSEDGAVGYRETVTVLKMQDLRPQLVDMAVAELRGWVRRYSHLSPELDGVVGAILGALARREESLKPEDTDQLPLIPEEECVAA